MNIIDIVAAVLGVGALALGYNRGFVAQLVSIAGLFLAYLAAYWLYDDVAPLAANLLPLERAQSYNQYAFLVERFNLRVIFYNAVAFAFVFFAVRVGLSFAGRILHLAASIPGIKTINKWSGAALALIEAIILFVVAVNVMSVLPSDSIQRALAESESSLFVMEHMPELAAKLHELWERA